MHTTLIRLASGAKLAFCSIKGLRVSLLHRGSTLTSVCIFSTLFFVHSLGYWQGEFDEQSWASLVGDHFLYSHDLNVLFSGDTWRRTSMLVTFRVKTVHYCPFILLDEKKHCGNYTSCPTTLHTRSGFQPWMNAPLCRWSVFGSWTYSLGASTHQGV